MNNRGGARPGAGRPKGSGTGPRVLKHLRREQIGVRLPAFMVEWLRDQPEPAGRIIEEAIRNYLWADGWTELKNASKISRIGKK